MGFMFRPVVSYIANCRDEPGDYYSDRTLCRVCMDYNGNTKISEPNILMELDSLTYCFADSNGMNQRADL